MESWKKFVAGCASGGIEAFITYPTEFIKTQTQLKKESPVIVIQRFSREKGIASIYKGVDVHILGTALKAGVRFYSYEFYKDILSTDKELTKPMLVLAGLLSGITEALIAVTPSETVKTKLIHDQRLLNPRFQGMFHAIPIIFREQGLRGLYQGAFPVVMRQGANQMIRFTTYSLLKEKATTNGYNGGYVTFGIGFIAGGLTTITTMPLDVVKTRMQGLESSKYRNSLNCLVTVVKESGVSALWSGTLPRLTRVSMSGGIVFYFYEKILKVIT
eukprot:NODE_502_length_7546_cov_0.138982.p3 type:complete len:273 gc:universal NODE_502_length_7546_cov_0.138982:6404-7222(+)